MQKSILAAGPVRTRGSERVLRRAAVLLRQIERGTRFNQRLLRRFISLASGMRLPAAARVAARSRALFGPSIGAWTRAAMRGPSAWSVGERELMAAAVADWNACPFCRELHGAAAARHLGRALVDAVLLDYHFAPISAGLKATLEFLQIMSLRPRELTEAHADAVLDSGISIETLTNAIEVCVVLKLISRYANALDFAIPAATDPTARPTGRSIVSAGAS